MSKLYGMNIFILCIFLLHFVAVSNKEQSFLKLKEDSEAKHEFALNAQTKVGQLEEFKNGLGSRTEEFTFQSLSEEGDKKSLRWLNENNTPEDDKTGDNPGNTPASGDNPGDTPAPEDTPEDTPGESKKSEESKKPEESKKTKSNDWKTLNIKKKIKALKRYRIVNRQKTLIKK